MLFSCLRNS